MAEHLKLISKQDTLSPDQKRAALVFVPLILLNGDGEKSMTEPQNELQVTPAPQPNIRLSSFDDKLRAMGIIDEEGNQLPPSEKEGTGEDLNPDQLEVAVSERMAHYTGNTATPGQSKHKETMEIEMDQRLANMAPEERDRALAKMEEDKRRAEETAARVSETGRWRKYTLHVLPPQLLELPDFTSATSMGYPLKENITELYNQYYKQEQQKKHEDSLATLVVIARELYRLYKTHPKTFTTLYLKVANLARDFATYHSLPLSTEKLKAM